VLEVLKGVQTIEEIAKDFDIYPMQVADWKKAWPGVPGASSAPVGRRSKPRILSASAMNDTPRSGNGPLR
jgi:transposase-like protein